MILRIDIKLKPLHNSQWLRDKNTLFSGMLKISNKKLLGKKIVRKIYKYFILL